MRLKDTGIEHHFSQAVESLIGAADIRVRIKSAYLDFSPILVDEVPSDLGEKYNALLRDLTRMDGAGGKVEATLRAMDDAQCELLAMRIFELYELIHEMTTLDDYDADRASDLE